MTLAVSLLFWNAEDGLSTSMSEGSHIKGGVAVFPTDE